MNFWTPRVAFSGFFLLKCNTSSVALQKTKSNQWQACAGWCSRKCKTTHLSAYTSRPKTRPSTAV
jgi:hypothetical protein